LCCDFHTRMFRTVFIIRRSAALSRKDKAGFFLIFLLIIV
jgi:hypothetical protein